MGIAAAFNKKGQDAITIVHTMLDEMKHRETATPVVASHPKAFIEQSTGKVSAGEASSNVAVGTNSAEPALGADFTWVLEGRFYVDSNSLSFDQIKHTIGHQPLKACRHILNELDGSYTFALAFPDKIVVGRDVIGTKPLYYGETESVCAVASERKALWKVGIAGVKSFPPGNLAFLTGAGLMFESVSTFSKITLGTGTITIEHATEHLAKLLEESTRTRVSDIKKIAVAFSGGLDSSIIAVLAKRAKVSVNLISVGLKGQKEVEGARGLAETLGLPLTLQTFVAADVENVLPKVLWLIEKPDVMKAGVAIPFFWTAEIAAKLGYQVLLSGQGADELFGGYHKYLVEYAKRGAAKAEEAMFNDTVTSYETNFQRDEPVCAFHKIDLRLPFTDRKVVNFALSLPVNLKIETAHDLLRKKVLRQTAQTLGVPAVMAGKPKRAIQFATGVDKALRNLASAKRLTPHSYVAQVFEEVYPSLEARKV